MWIRCLRLIVGLLAMSSVVAADEGPKFLRAVEGIAEFQLSNGLQVLLFPDPSSPKVTVNLTVFVGSKHEGYGEAGMAHLLEHMVFKGTPTHPDIPGELRRRGDDYNGTTWLDRTNYYETMPSSDENLEFGIRLEADRLVNSFIKAEHLASEMTVVRNEFEQGENQPERVLMQRVMAAGFEWHNYGKSTIGNRADIERVPVENLRRFYQRFYQPDNCMLIIAGKFDPRKALQLIQTHFGAIPRPARELDRTYTEEPAQDGERLVTVRRVGQVPVAMAMYHIPAGGHPDFAAIDILSRVMTSEPSGRVYDALVKRRIAASVYGFNFSTRDPGALMIGAEAAQGTDGPAILQNLIDSIEGAAEKPFTAEEVERARSELLRERELQLADSKSVAIELSDWAALGDWRLFFLHRDHLEKVTPDDVTRSAQQFLVRNNRTAGLFEPTQAAERISIPQTPDIAQLVGDYRGRSEISQGEEFDASPEGIESRLVRSALGSGLKVTLLPKKTRGSIVTLRINLRYGNADALQGLSIATQILPQLMDRGTESLTRQQISDELNNYRAQMRISGTPGTLSVGIQTSRENLVPVLKIVEQILRHPTFPEEELALIREEQIAGISQQISDPVALARTGLMKRLAPYEPGDPRYVQSPQEEIEALRTLTAEQIRDVYQRLLGSAAGELTVIGDFDPDQVTTAVEQLTASWKSDIPFERLARESVNNPKGELSIIETPDKENAVYVAGLTIAMRDSHPDYPALALANFILGGSTLSSRLGDRLRQKDGLSYGVQSVLQPNAIDERTQLMIFAISNPQNAVRVRNAVQEELQRLLKDGITEDELKSAITGYLQEQQVQRTEDRALVSLLEAYRFIGRDMKWMADFENAVSELTVDQVNSALRKHLNPDRLYIFQAGDFSKAEE